MFAWPIIATILVLLRFCWSHVLCFLVAAGALTGAIAGALAAKATKSGLLRGISFGAIAGSILSVEVLEASRAYWCMEQTGSRGASSMVGTHFVVDFPGLFMSKIICTSQLWGTIWLPFKFSALHLFVLAC